MQASATNIVSQEMRNPKKRPPPAWLFTILPELLSKASGELITFSELCDAFGLTRNGLRRTAYRYLGKTPIFVPMMEDGKRGKAESAWRVDYLKTRLGEIWERYPNEVKKHRSR